MRGLSQLMISNSLYFLSIQHSSCQETGRQQELPSPLSSAWCNSIKYMNPLRKCGIKSYHLNAPNNGLVRQLRVWCALAVY